MPGRIETFVLPKRAWIPEEITQPGRDFAVDQHLPDGRILHYRFKCLDDDKESRLTSSSNGSPESVVTTLRSGDKPFILAINGGQGNPRFLRRFSHY